MDKQLKRNLTKKKPILYRMNKVLGPITGGLLLDFIDFATFGPFIFLGFFIGGIVGYWISSIYNFSNKTRLIWTFASAFYCLIPFTEIIPVASIIFAIAKLGENKKYQEFMNSYENYEQREREILNLIKEQEGKVSPIDLAAKISLTVDDCKKFLDDLIEKGLGSTHVTEHGNLIYVFEDLCFKKEQKDLQKDSPTDNQTQRTM